VNNDFVNPKAEGAPLESPLVRLENDRAAGGSLDGREYASKGGSGADVVCTLATLLRPTPKHSDGPTPHDVGVWCDRLTADRVWGRKKLTGRHFDMS
jgi:hypothetical protein